MKKPYISGIIVAAGDGTRMGGVIKPLLLLSEKTLLERVIEQFCLSDIIDEIVVVSKDLPEIKDIIARYSSLKKIIFTLGGSTRQESVYNGIAKTSKKTNFIMIHDCARPFIDVEMINLAYQHALGSGASCVSKPVTDTIKYRTDNGVNTPRRDRLFAVETPQTFLKDMYYSSYALALKNHQSFTDETSMVENAGFKVDYFFIDKINMKITTQNDLLIAKSLVEER